MKQLFPDNEGSNLQDFYESTHSNMLFENTVINSRFVIGKQKTYDVFIEVLIKAFSVELMCDIKKITINEGYGYCDLLVSYLVPAEKEAAEMLYKVTIITIY
jgi:hypothetical protein